MSHRVKWRIIVRLEAEIDGDNYQELDWEYLSDSECLEDTMNDLNALDADADDKMHEGRLAMMKLEEEYEDEQD